MQVVGAVGIADIHGGHCVGHRCKKGRETVKAPCKVAGCDAGVLYCVVDGLIESPEPVAYTGKCICRLEDLGQWFGLTHNTATSRRPYTSLLLTQLLI